MIMTSLECVIIKNNVIEIIFKILVHLIEMITSSLTLSISFLTLLYSPTLTISFYFHLSLSLSLYGMQVALLWNVDKNKDGKEKETGKSRGRGRDKGEDLNYGKIFRNIAKNNLFIIAYRISTES